MNLKLKYCVILDRIKDVPDSSRILAEQRFLLIKEYEDIFVKKEKELLGRQFRNKKATIKYCQSKEVPLTSFYRWLRQYRRYGIEGLVLSYGNQQTSKARGKRQTKKIKLIKLDIETHRPLSCLPELKNIIQRDPDISPKIKETSVQFLDTVIGFSKQKLVKSHRLLSCLPKLKDIIQRDPDVSPKIKKTTVQFLDTVIGFSKQKFLAPQNLPLTQEEIKELEVYEAGTHKNRSPKATAILMAHRGHSIFEIATTASRSRNTIYRWFRLFKSRGTAFIPTYLGKGKREAMWQKRTTRVIAILHTPPKTYGINRTAWTRGTLRQAYRKTYGENLSWCSIPRIIKATNYTWRRARDVLTSPDPEYKRKAQKVLDTLRGLGPSEAFFFIDEAGPWQVKKYGGESFTPKGTTKIYPRFQKSKGQVTFIAALDAVGNQISWLFTKGKDTGGIIDIIRVLYYSYCECSTLYLTWDCASWHKSQELRKFLAGLNARKKGPVIKIVPLPSRAQFLNVIESVISGMKRAVIHNSDYRSELEMQTAIAMHFHDRNEYFWQNPKRAGDKIWDKERFNIDDFESGLHKRM